MKSKEEEEEDYDLSMSMADEPSYTDLADDSTLEPLTKQISPGTKLRINVRKWFKNGMAMLGNFLSLSFFLVIIVLVGIAFDVGGKFCGLVLTLALEAYFCSVAFLKLFGLRKFAVILHFLEPLLVLQLLIIVLNISPSLEQNKIANYVIHAWNVILLHCTPLFNLLEGLASLLVIQALGHLGRWLVHYKSENWMFFILLNASSVISMSLYLLYRVSSFTISNCNAVMIGFSLAAVTVVSIYGVSSGRASLSEASLMFSYIAYTVYMVCTDFGNPTTISTQKPNFDYLPPDVLQSVHHLLSSISSIFPKTLSNIALFMVAAIKTVAPSVFATFAYRITVMYAVTRILPAIQQNIIYLEYSRTTKQSLWTVISPCILIAVYTNLLLQHLYPAPSFSSLTNQILCSAEIWRWVSAILTIILYAVELAYSKESNTGQALASHFKLD
ncbi:ICE2 family ER membrane protein [Schizosaccharomyces octosporus yFS286]|uniref:ICE2 family ER membrane protein n=1 Tax=Schizosaccharomyces octosporus (strain yFS286) TaxID=483514 RepID=S9PSY8_SCHOY|nr:ICE2 family ER membrane protein [Schizosaccharomyces octosporus yFS286]EPX70588.1 ICE2 family ER membrane protein [Schizosaccharomyces octosporus yFS286]